MRAVLLGRPDRDQHGVDARARSRSSTSGQVMRSMKCSATAAIFARMSDIVQSTRPMRHRGGAMEGMIAGQRRRALVPDHGRGRAGRPDPRRRASATSTSRPATPELSKHFKVVDYDMRGYGQSDRPVQDYDMEVWADDVAGLLDALDIDRGARPRHLDGRDDRDRLRRQVPGADDVGRDQLRRREARAWPAGSIFKNWIDIAAPGPGRAGQPDPRRADRLAGALEGVPRDARRRRRDRHDPADPARLEPDRGLHRRVPGDVRHGHHAAGCRRSPRRRSCSAATRT